MGPRFEDHWDEGGNGHDVGEEGALEAAFDEDDLVQVLKIS